MTNTMTERPTPFVKMHGAGNDFIMLDGRDLPSAALPDRQMIAALCHRQRGIGADGLIVIGTDAEVGDTGRTDFRMTYFNADGGEAEMCGNGARCSVAFAHQLGLIEKACVFATQMGPITGLVHGPEDISVGLPGWRDLNLDLELSGSPWTRLSACHTGVPHLVVVLGETDNIDEIDLPHWGRIFRFHEQFGAAGTNVNWVSWDAARDEYRLRTYERGVEAETLACGTGASAAAVVLCHLGLAHDTVGIRTRGGDLLRVTVDTKAQAIQLRGPAVCSYSGTTLLRF